MFNDYFVVCKLVSRLIFAELFEEAVASKAIKFAEVFRVCNSKE
jgi:hypothetical protein